MRKRVRIAVVVAALLLAVVAPTVTTADHRQAAEAGAMDWRAAYRTLAGIIPRTGWTRTHRPASLADRQWWQVAHVACRVNEAHDNVYEYETEVDYLLSQLGWPNPYRYQSPALELSRRIHQYKEDAGSAYEYGSQVFCSSAERFAKPHAAATTR
jgi:hypothetical protein